MFGSLSTHPPLLKRILAIDPSFDGQFAHVNSLPRQPAENLHETQDERLYQKNLRRARAEAKARQELE
jgi:hypothetical protein